MDVTALVEEIKDAVTEAVSRDVVTVFQRMFDSDMQRSFVFLKSKTTLRVLTVLNDFGSVVESQDLALVLINKQSGVQYAGSGGSCGAPVQKTQFPHSGVQYASSGGSGGGGAPVQKTQFPHSRVQFASSGGSGGGGAPVEKTHFPPSMKMEQQTSSSSGSMRGECNESSYFSGGKVSQKSNVGGGDVQHSSFRVMPSRGTVQQQSIHQSSQKIRGSIFDNIDNKNSIGHPSMPPKNEPEESGDNFESSDDNEESDDEDDNNPFQEGLDQLSFGIMIRSPTKRKGGSQRGMPKKKQALGGLTAENADKPENQDSLISMASSKEQQISLATSLLAVKRTMQSHDIVWEELKKINRAPSKGTGNPHSFLKIAVKYFRS